MTAKVIAKTMCRFNDICLNGPQKSHSFAETFSLKARLKKFGEQGYKAASNEMKQLHERAAFEPIKIENLTQKERCKAMESLMFLVEKHDGRVKARTCANGSVQ